MESAFWHERWESGQLGFHQESVNAHLTKFWSRLGLGSQDAVFVPLCGKSLDLVWLHEQGHHVLGVELSAIAIEDFFTAARLAPSKAPRGALVRYDAPGYELYVGDFFELESTLLRDVRGVYDRASLIALPPEMRERYAAKLIELLPVDARMLLLTIEYDQAKMKGPPHSVQREEVERLFGTAFAIESLEQTEPSAPHPRFQERGLDLWQERVYRLTPLGDRAYAR